jgi:alanine racemase
VDGQPDEKMVPVPTPRAEVVVDRAAIRSNVAALRAHVCDRDLMAVVKADGYGHGLAESAAAARAGGASWIGVALLDEALALRAAGDAGPLLSWLAVPGERYAAAVAADVEVAAYGVDQLAEIAAATGDRPAAVQLKVDTGLSRGGARAADWPRLVSAAAAYERSGGVRVTGVWSHLAVGEDPQHPANNHQLAVFEQALAVARAAGLRPRHVHVANSGATLSNPGSWYTMVRPGIAIYGLSPLAGASPVPLRPAMTVRASLAMVKDLPAGAGISYGHTYVTERPTRVGLVPLGYGDGIPRHASNTAAVAVAGACCRIVGQVCMDQFVVDLGDADARAGDEVVVFGDGTDGAPTASDWADAADTINYEIVTRICGRVPRRYVDAQASP